MMKRRGPRTKPWGTPVVTGKAWEMKDLTDKLINANLVIKCCVLPNKGLKVSFSEELQVLLCFDLNIHNQNSIALGHIVALSYCMCHLPTTYISCYLIDSLSNSKRLQTDLFCVTSAASISNQKTFIDSFYDSSIMKNSMNFLQTLWKATYVVGLLSCCFLSSDQCSLNSILFSFQISPLWETCISGLPLTVRSWGRVVHQHKLTVRSVTHADQQG